MNAYIIDAGDIHGDHGPERLVDIFIAPNRNRARYLFWQEYVDDLGDLTEGWCKHVRIVEKNVTGAEGQLEADHPRYAPIWMKSRDVLD